VFCAVPTAEMSLLAGEKGFDMFEVGEVVAGDHALHSQRVFPRNFPWIR
jgi:hypothetical protein